MYLRIYFLWFGYALVSTTVQFFYVLPGKVWKFSRIKISKKFCTLMSSLLKMGPTPYPETLGTNYPLMLHIWEDQITQCGAKEEDNIHTQLRNVRSWTSHNFYTKCRPRTLDHPKKPSKIRNTTNQPTRKKRPTAVLAAPKHQISRHNTKKDPAKNSTDSQCFLCLYSIFQWRL